MTDLSSQTEQSLIKKKERVTLLIDSSGSMGMLMDGENSGELKTRIHATTEAILAITNVSDSELTEYGLIAFNDQPAILSPFTTDYLSLYANCFVEPTAGTQMADGLSKAVQQSPDRIILLSDGEPTCRLETIWSIVQTASDLNIKIDTISIGGASDTIMQEIAKRTNGKWQRPTSPEELCHSFMQLETKNRLLLDHQQNGVLEI